MKHLKALLGIASLMIMGFIAYCVATGFVIIVALILIILPTWQVVLGTFLGSVSVFLYLIRNKSGTKQSF